jgi:uncharacterized protein
VPPKKKDSDPIMDTTPRIQIDEHKLTAFCEKWKITKLELFGSVLRDDFRPDSDVDVLATLVPNAGWTLFDWVIMAEELETIIGRKIDILTRRSIESSENYLLRRGILQNTKQIYAA